MRNARTAPVCQHHAFGGLQDGLRAMRERGELRPEADLEELSMALLTALQGGSLLSNTLRTAAPMRASMNAALAYLDTFTARDPTRIKA
jgi:hypothetical protein